MPEIRPYMMNNLEAAGKELLPLPTDSQVFQEEWLQKLLFKHPSILPITQLGEGYAPLVSLGREIGNIDNLFISPSGLLTIVETKLWRNPEAHRTVVAQILDYAKNLTTWNYTQLESAVSVFMTKQFGETKTTIFKLLKSKIHDVDLDEFDFQSRVQECLASGRFALVIVGDRIFPEATQLADTIHSAPHLHFTLGFVELKCYKLDKDSNWPLIVVPSVVARTKEFTRAVVKVVYEEKKPEVYVSAVEVEDDRPTARTNLSVFTASLPSGVKDAFTSYLERWQKAGYIIYWGTVGFSLRLLWKGRLRTVFDAYPTNASILQEKRATQYEFPPEIYRRYTERIMTSAALGTMLANGRRYLYYENMTEEDIALLLDTTNELADMLNKLRDSSVSLPSEP